MKTWILAMLLVVGSADALAQKLRLGTRESYRCDGGEVRGLRAPNSDPEENIQCKVLGKIFCIVEEQRSRGQSERTAVSQASDWLSRIGQTGTHLRGRFEPLVTGAVSYVYSHDQMLPWNQYYYAVYTCGLDQRLADAEKRQLIAEPWDKAAHECQRKFPGEGNGYGNEPLRDCLRNAMNQTVAAANK